MRFVVHAKDKPGASARRMEVLEAHRTHLAVAPATFGVQVLLSGPLVTDDGEAMTGSFFLLDAPDRASIEALFEQDPLVQADIWDSIAIDAVMIRQNNM